MIKAEDGDLPQEHRKPTSWQLSEPGRCVALPLPRQNSYLTGGKRFAARGPERDAPDESRTLKLRMVGGEGQELVAARAAAPARGAVLDP